MTAEVFKRPACTVLCWFEDFIFLPQPQEMVLSGLFLFCKWSPPAAASYRPDRSKEKQLSECPDVSQVGFQGGVPITEEFYCEHISGKFNSDLGVYLFPDWDVAAQTKFTDDKEALFRRLAGNALEGKNGLSKFCSWMKKNTVRRAAVTNAPRLNAEQMIASVGLGDFFEYLVIGAECTRAKPFPDPYLKALSDLGVSADEAFVFEDSPSGIKAAVDAGLAVVGVVSANPQSALLKAGAAFCIESFDDAILWKALEIGSSE